MKQEFKTHLHSHFGVKEEIIRLRNSGYSYRRIAEVTSQDSCDDQNCGTTICKLIGLV